MSSSRQYYVHCDEMAFDDCEGTFCDGDIGHLTATEQRKRFKENGWARKEGRDICENCLEFLREKEK